MSHMQIRESDSNFKFDKQSKWVAQGFYFRKKVIGSKMRQDSRRPQVGFSELRLQRRLRAWDNMQ